MIFIGYSSKDRYTIVEPILFHLKHFGFSVWYDFHDMFLGDDRYETNFLNGIGGSSYIIFIISPNLFESPCATEELEFAKGLIESGQAVFFPIFYNFSPNMLPAEFDWIHNIIYNEVKSDSGTRHAAYQVVERIIHDEIKLLPYQNLNALIENKILNDDYTIQLLKTWSSVDERNYGVRMGILHSVYQYLPAIETKYNKSIQYVFSVLQFNEAPNHLMYSIFEKSILAYLTLYSNNKK